MLVPVMKHLDTSEIQCYLATLPRVLEARRFGRVRERAGEASGQDQACGLRVVELDIGSRLGNRLRFLSRDLRGCGHRSGVKCISRSSTLPARGWIATVHPLYLAVPFSPVTCCKRVFFPHSGLWGSGVGKALR